MEGCRTCSGWIKQVYGFMQVNYILGNNPLGMSYMVGYGDKFPNRIHHRGSSLPSMDAHPDRIDCNGGTPYFQTQDPNPNLLTGAVVGGPAPDDSYADSRADVSQSEPATYINAPLVGLLAYFKANSWSDCQWAVTCSMIRFFTHNDPLF